MLNLSLAVALTKFKILAPRFEVGQPHKRQTFQAASSMSVSKKSSWVHFDTLVSASSMNVSKGL